MPDEIIEIKEVPRTLSGKKLKVPIKKLLLGGNSGRVFSKEAMANPDSLDFFVDFFNSRLLKVDL